MELYQRVAADNSRRLTDAYSTSFGLATRLFDRSIRPGIYGVYGLTRLADEIVDTYSGDGRPQLLDELEAEVRVALRRGYSTNLVVQAFVDVARPAGIGSDLTGPFFASMRMDLTPATYRSSDYETYIYGSAQVVGLMCLKVFCAGDERRYEQLKTGAAALGAAYQKINFLRDLKDDYERLGRYYFPNGSYAEFDEAVKQAIVESINRDLAVAQPAIAQLPRGARPAVLASYRYYTALLAKLGRTPADTIKQQRVRVSNGYKLAVLLWTRVAG